MPANIDSFPAELLLAIIASLVTTNQFNIGQRSILFVHKEVLPLSQVNQRFRRLCLPQIYKHILVLVAQGDVFQSRAGPFQLFKRITERKPHLAELVR